MQNLIVIQEKKKLLKEQLPAEPDGGVKDVATIRLRCPDGASLVRRFLGDDRIEVGWCVQQTNFNNVFFIYSFFSSTLGPKAITMLIINFYHLFQGEMYVTELY